MFHTNFMRSLFSLLYWYIVLKGNKWQGHNIAVNVSYFSKHYMNIYQYDNILVMCHFEKVFISLYMYLLVDHIYAHTIYCICSTINQTIKNISNQGGYIVYISKQILSMMLNRRMTNQKPKQYLAFSIILNYSIMSFWNIITCKSIGAQNTRFWEDTADLLHCI